MAGQVGKQQLAASGWLGRLSIPEEYTCRTVLQLSWIGYVQRCYQQNRSCMISPAYLSKYFSFVFDALRSYDWTHRVARSSKRGSFDDYISDYTDRINFLPQFSDL